MINLSLPWKINPGVKCSNLAKYKIRIQNLKKSSKDKKRKKKALKKVCINIIMKKEQKYKKGAKWKRCKRKEKYKHESQKIR